MRKGIKRFMVSLVIVGLLGVTSVLAIDGHVRKKGNQLIMTKDNVFEADAILILGALVYQSGNVSNILEDRLKVGVELYEMGKAPKLLLSGDNGQLDYDEVNAMKNYVVARGIPEEDVFMDHAGFSTYESVYRAKEIFQVERLIIVTQEYHLKRALYVSKKLGIEAQGVTSDLRTYPKMSVFKTREILARNKDFLYVNVFKPEPTYLGEVINITGDGRITFDKD
ncbi:SanA/YdcF family protein [Natranaerovirga pectinivora]|nr:ElyC/SanA/YdcF family protein [Natranaerovirga pectinivora]